jgi:hypothetical protein
MKSQGNYFEADSMEWQLNSVILEVQTYALFC